MSASRLDDQAFRSLRARLALWNAGVFAVVLAGFAAACLAMVDQASLGAMDDANQNTLGVLVGSLRPGPLDLGEFEEEALEDHASATLRVAALYAPDGRLLGSAFPGAEGLAAGPARETRVVGGLRLRMARATAPAGNTVLVGRDLAAADALYRRFALGLAGAVPLALLLTLLAGRFLAGRAARPLRDMLEQQRQFLADASHELRTPLAVILTSTDVALQDPAPTLASQAAALGRIGRTGRRMGKLVDDLLFLTRAEWLAPSERRGFDLAELLAELRDEWQEVADARGLAIRLEGPATLEAVADPEQVGRAVAILLDNAVKFSPVGGVVRLALVDEGPRGCAIAVHDQGPGIALEAQPLVFERFYRGEAAGTLGTGLGLAIARAIARAHGGRLGLESAPGQGSTFTLWLPHHVR